MIGNQAQQGRCFIILLILTFLSINCYEIYAQDEILAIIGKNVSLICNSTVEKIWWTKNDENITRNQKRFIIAQYPIEQQRLPNENAIIDSDNENHHLNSKIDNHHQHYGIHHYKYINYLNITMVESNDTGVYACHNHEYLDDGHNQHHHHHLHSSVASDSEHNSNVTITKKQYKLLAIIPPHIIEHSPSVIRAEISRSLEFYCLIEMHPIVQFNNSIKWYKNGESTDSIQSLSQKLNSFNNRTKFAYINSTHCNVTLDIIDASKKDNGTYICSIMPSAIDDAIRAEQMDMDKYRTTSINTTLLVLDVPHVSIDYVKSIGANKFFLNWTVSDGNDLVSEYYIQYMREGEATFNYYNHIIGGSNRSYVLDNFEPDTKYNIKITAKNRMGMGPAYIYPQLVQTLKTDPVFTPEIEVKGSSHSTITIGLQPLPPELFDYIQCYELIVSEVTVNGTATPKKESLYPQDSRNLPYMFDHLKTATKYKFQVRACNELTGVNICGNWSKEVTGTTMDGTSTEPINLKVQCSYYNISGRKIISVQWDPPTERNGKIISYNIILNGIARYRNESGIWNNATYGPKIKSVIDTIQKAEYDNIPTNTNYTIQVAAVTRSKKPGDYAIAQCRMPPTIPHDLGSMLWGKIETDLGYWIYKLFLQRISERNGPICGYRIYLVRLPPGGIAPTSSGGGGGTIANGDGGHSNHNNNNNKYLQPPENLNIMSYHEVHDINNKNGGAYIAEIISMDNFHSEIFLGDGKQQSKRDSSVMREQNESCRKLLNGYYKKSVKQAKSIGKDGTNDSIGTVPAIANASGGGGVSPSVSSPISTQKERLDKAGNLTSEASKILNSKHRRRRRHVIFKRYIANNIDDRFKRQNEIPSSNNNNNNINVNNNQNADVGEKNADNDDDDDDDDADEEDIISDNISINDNTNNRLIDNNAISDGDHQIDFNKYEIFDGLLDPNSNYTGFVEVIVNIDDENKTQSTFSEYFDTMLAGPPENDDTNSDLSYILNIVVQILCVLILLVLVLLMALCFLQRYYSKHSSQGEEVISLRDSLSRALCGRRMNNNHRHLIGGLSSSKPTDVGPIMKLELPSAYLQRHKDTDYGFLREYEMLPNRFNDRTTKNSDAKENALKNRYPDIKAYDQTRVRLAERNGTIGSDYINANFVLGYKERKKFICAQGPMDSTVNDFWRMIWEHHLEIIVMLTNLEEYNKAKCAKYWPEKINDLTKFGDITVTFLEEHRYSDYTIRELKVTRKNSSAVNNDDEEEIRNITQYHYLVWKDFMAPEHPHGIIKFIRKINSVYSLQRGPILVHCSAGVGRTGTLVALDSLMQQLDDEHQVSIFNTVCDMRHQRNFLVQSLKQYIFLYRALLDIAQFGNTEIFAKDLTTTVENLKLRQSDSKEQCKLELEFEKLKSINDDTNKSCSVGSGDENRCKNRSECVIPFDRNRVILTPIPNREHSTYINASFIEGYDNSESFIITQDPLESTIGDFWRMIGEQGINTIVMMSEIGDGPKKCLRYWADDEIQYDHILVKYIQSESCPYYTRREFDVVNCKIKDTIKVTQIQYNGWPTVDGEVPEVTRGMIELVDQALNYQNNNSTQDNNYLSSIFDGPIVVHCNMGTDRSSIFIAMCILVQQLRTEKKIDICSVVRKLRSQRNLLIDSYSQYEFLHRAIVNYADLHGLSLANHHLFINE